MSNKTLIPALSARVGDWSYYVCVMKYGQVAREFSFEYELNGGNRELQQIIQRGLTDRTKEIVSYLKENEHRFLGALIVAAWGGDPHFTTVEMQDAGGLLENIDEGFGVLTFDGSQQYFALDGQHRLRAIKDAIKEKPELGNEEICVLIVSHYDSEEGRLRTRRLFSNINRNAKPTSKSENIALDEDDPFAILARRMVREHDFLSVDGRVDVIKKDDPDAGELKLATASVNKTHPTAWTTLQTLYGILGELSWGLDIGNNGGHVRPSDEVLDAAFKTLSERIDKLLQASGDLRSKLEKAKSARDLRAPRNQEGFGHPFMRPAIQRSLAKVVGMLAAAELLEEDEIYSRVSELPWQIDAGPWRAIALTEGNKVKMQVNRDTRELFERLLRCHLFPESKAQIRQARSEYKRVRGTPYPFSDEELAAKIDAN